MRELIALRAKIDLLQQDKENEIDETRNIMHVVYCNGMRDAYDEIREMIDDMVGKQLEDMYAEHLQEEASQTN